MLSRFLIHIYPPTLGIKGTLRSTFYGTVGRAEAAGLHGGAEALPVETPRTQDATGFVYAG